MHNAAFSNIQPPSVNDFTNPRILQNFSDHLNALPQPVPPDLDWVEGIASSPTAAATIRTRVTAEVQATTGYAELVEAQKSLNREHASLEATEARELVALKGQNHNTEPVKGEKVRGLDASDILTLSVCVALALFGVSGTMLLVSGAYIDNLLAKGSLMALLMAAPLMVVGILPKGLYMATPTRMMKHRILWLISAGALLLAVPTYLLFAAGFVGNGPSLATTGGFGVPAADTGVDWVMKAFYGGALLLEMLGTSVCFLMVIATLDSRYAWIQNDNTETQRIQQRLTAIGGAILTVGQIRGRVAGKISAANAVIEAAVVEGEAMVEGLVRSRTHMGQAVSLGFIPAAGSASTNEAPQPAPQPPSLWRGSLNGAASLLLTLMLLFGTGAAVAEDASEPVAVAVVFPEPASLSTEHRNLCGTVTSHLMTTALPAGSRITFIDGAAQTILARVTVAEAASAAARNKLIGGALRQVAQAFALPEAATPAVKLDLPTVVSQTLPAVAADHTLIFASLYSLSPDEGFAFTPGEVPGPGFLWADPSALPWGTAGVTPRLDGSSIHILDLSPSSATLPNKRPVVEFVAHWLDRHGATLVTCLPQAELVVEAFVAGEQTALIGTHPDPQDREVVIRKVGGELVNRENLINNARVKVNRAATSTLQSMDLRNEVDDTLPVRLIVVPDLSASWRSHQSMVLASVEAAAAYLPARSPYVRVAVAPFREAALTPFPLSVVRAEAVDAGASRDRLHKYLGSLEGEKGKVDLLGAATRAFATADASTGDGRIVLLFDHRHERGGSGR